MAFACRGWFDSAAIDAGKGESVISSGLLDSRKRVALGCDWSAMEIEFGRHRTGCAGWV